MDAMVHCPDFLFRGHTVTAMGAPAEKAQFRDTASAVSLEQPIPTANQNEDI